MRLLKRDLHFFVAFDLLLFFAVPEKESAGRDESNHHNKYGPYSLSRVGYPDVVHIWRCTRVVIHRSLLFADCY